MADYRRWYVPGGTYFFTVVTYCRRPLFEDAEARRLLEIVMREAAAGRPFETVAFVLLWDHLHYLWTLPPGDADYSTRWKEIKTHFTRAWLAAGGTELPVSVARHARGRRGVWQPRFWEHVIRDELDLEGHCDYIHYNPVKHGYVARPKDWPYSTFRRFVEAGQYDENWGETEPPSIAGMDYE